MNQVLHCLISWISFWLRWLSVVSAVFLRRMKSIPWILFICFTNVKEIHVLYYHCAWFGYPTNPSNYLQVIRLGNNCKNDIDHLNFPRLFKVTVNKTKLVVIRVGTCKPLKTKLTVFAELNYQPARYRGHQNKLDCITQQIIRKLRVWGFNFFYSHWILGNLSWICTSANILVVVTCREVTDFT